MLRLSISTKTFSCICLADHFELISVLLNQCVSELIKVILYSYLILKKMNERITDS